MTKPLENVLLCISSKWSRRWSGSSMSLTRNRFLPQSCKSVHFAANHSATFPDHFNLQVSPSPIYSPDVADQNLNPIIILSQDGHPCSETCYLLPVNTGSWYRWTLTSTTSPMRALKGCRQTQNQALCDCYVYVHQQCVKFYLLFGVGKLLCSGVIKII